MSVAWKRRFRRRWGWLFRPSTCGLPLIVLCIGIPLGIILGHTVRSVYEKRVVAPAIAEAGEMTADRLAAGAMSREPWMLASGKEAIFPLSPEVDSFHRGYKFTETETTAEFGGSISSNFDIVVDVDSGEVLGKRNAYDKMYPASMTKVMTVLVAAKHITE